MTKTNQIILALDVGERRIGVAWGDTAVRVVSPLAALEMNDDVPRHIEKLVRTMDASRLVLGLPRNQSGEETAQSQYVRNFAKALRALDVPIEFQDESLTSVVAEQRLQDRKKPFTKAEIDSEAAVIILTDYLEQNYAK